MAAGPGMRVDYSEGIHIVSSTTDRSTLFQKIKLSTARWGVVATTFTSGGKEYAVFAGGSTVSDIGTLSRAIDVFSMDGQWTLELSSTRMESTAVSIGDTALFGGGRYSGSTGSNNINDVYLSNGAPATNKTTNFTQRYHHAAAVAGDYAYFAGGD